MNLSATQSQPSRNQDDSTFSKKKKKIFDASEQISSILVIIGGKHTDH
ncbi:hypothetical protein Gohar_026820 [Gossypium harknessii]|uniref:Uncharacterized protein n=1 Tax=Gossypium harknessii TaxID=34285 RepID=A0A7J9HTG1_9ROSI|nr:hypothetical protein [Gossypium harknessii]